MSRSQRRAQNACQLLVATALAGTLVAGCGGADSTADPRSPTRAGNVALRQVERADIRLAARAPYIALLGRHARALCAAFTPAAVGDLAQRVSDRPSCEARVAEVFARSAPFEPKWQPAILDAVSAAGVVEHDGQATAIITYRRSGFHVVLHLMRERRLWRVSTMPRLTLVRGCFVRGVLTERCPAEARIMLFGLGTPTARLARDAPAP